MKTKAILFSILAVGALLFAACNSQNWDDHYFSEETVIENDQLADVQVSTEAYLSDPAQADLSQMYGFLKENGVFDKLKGKSQLFTILVVSNEHFVQPGEEEAEYIAFSHVTDMSVSPANLHDGERILMWHNKFVTVGMDSLALLGDLSHISFNGSPVSRVVRTTDGYIYELDAMISTPVSLYDYINELPEEYSMFREMVLASGGKQFDKKNSKAIGVDATGNTIYDTVWIYTNDFFDAKNFSLSSESLTATMFLSSDEVINAALADANARLSNWGLERDRDIIMRWILEASFFRSKYSPADLVDNDDEAFLDLKSIYDRQWRMEAQGVDIDHPIEVSNGTIYEVTKLYIPNNVLIYRIKDYYRNYEYCTDQQKSIYYNMFNLKSIEVKTEVEPWTPEAGVWPMHGCFSLSAYCDDPSLGFNMNMETIHCVYDEQGNVTDVAPYNIPPGTYRFAMGFAQNLNMTFNIKVYAVIGTSRQELGSSTITVGSTTEFHYDRGTFLSDTWPEGYKEVKDALTNSKKNNYDTDGGCVIEELVLPDLLGNNTAYPLYITCECTSGTSSRIIYHHWCLRPNKNNY
ncbi:MAG: hypothetical protein IJ154_00835 [Bacteroidales bacterium]|nr:hypothetical protein [Bacteroidales bacterium]